LKFATTHTRSGTIENSVWPTLHVRARLDALARDAPGLRRVELRVREVELGLTDGGRELVDLPCRHAILRHRIVTILERDEAPLDEPLVTTGIDVGANCLGLGGRQISACLREARLEIPRVELHEQIARLHVRVVVDVDTGDVARHLRTHADDGAVDERVVGGLVRSRVRDVAGTEYEQHHGDDTADRENDAAPGPRPRRR